MPGRVAGHACKEARITAMQIRTRTRKDNPQSSGRSDRTAIERWHADSLNGDEASRRQMMRWVHEQAMTYYLSKAGIEPLLTPQDAEDLASECILEFSRCWNRVRSIPHYCRRMYKNNLHRYLKRKRRNLHRESRLASEETDRAVQKAVSCRMCFEFERFSDEDLGRIRFATEELERADEVVRTLFHYRVLSGSLTYAEIGDVVGATETSLRMRMARFNRRVRRRYAQTHETEGVVST
jgi:DNA-directed RNA polymerase specialized sigma24 family protein